MTIKEIAEPPAAPRVGSGVRAGVLQQAPIARRDTRHSETEARFYVLGRTGDGGCQLASPGRFSMGKTGPRTFLVFLCGLESASLQVG